MLGSFAVPENWHSTFEASFIEPDSASVADPRLLGRERGMPGARMSIRRGRVQTDSPKASLAEFAKVLIGTVPGIRTLAEGPMEFSDGTVGAMVTFMLDNEGITWVQRHLYRHDQDWVTHFTLSVVASDHARLDAELWEVVDRWRP